jgi:hypothetical protein
MLIGTKEYGTWKDGSSIYKDSKGYYIVDIGLDRNPYKKYLENWKPTNGEPQLCLKKNKWVPCKKSKKTRKLVKYIHDTTIKTRKKYLTRKSPPYPANEYCGKTKKGNDGQFYISVPDKNKICKWKLKSRD